VPLAHFSTPGPLVPLAEELKSTLQASSRPPQEKSRLPMTTSQEIGWFAREAKPEPYKVRAAGRGHGLHHGLRACCCRDGRRVQGTSVR
jgi:hypothetical protein